MAAILVTIGKLAGFLRSSFRAGPLCDCTQYIVEGVYEFDGSRGRKCQPCRHVNNRLLGLLRRIFHSVRKKAGCPYGDDDRTSVIGHVDQLIPINLQDMRIIFNHPWFRLYVGHGQSLIL